MTYTIITWGYEDCDNRDMTTKVTIVGAGLIGASIAWRLAQTGARVTLIDAGSWGGETSSAGAGMLAPGGEFEGPSAWLEMGLESMRLYPQFVEELKAETGVPIDFQRCGCMHFCEPEAARRRAEFQRTKGTRVEVTPQGLFDPDDGLVDPTDLLRGLRHACEARNVTILENQRLTQIELGRLQRIGDRCGSLVGPDRGNPRWTANATAWREADQGSPDRI